ncbi:lipocalin-like domain-containing protein [Chloroflexota bacterium]
MARETRWGYEIEPRDYALHPSDAPGWWEWWYFDADLENGYTIAGTFHFGSPRPPANPDVRFIEIALYDPEDNKRMVRKRYPKEQCSASEDTCKVVIGPNVFEGEIPRFRLFFQEGEQGCDLIYESMVEGFMPRDPTSSVGSAVVGWVIPTARAKVSGTITWEGRTMEVKGDGYHDHNWSDAPMSGAGDSQDLLALMGLPIGDWTLNFSGGRSQRKQGYKPYGVMYAYKKEKVVAVSEKGGGSGSDYAENALGIKYPQAYKLWWDEPGLVEGEIRLKLKQVIDFMDLHRRFKPFQRWFAETYVGRPAYFRYRLDYDADITVLGERVTGQGQSWCEYHKFV